MKRKGISPIIAAVLLVAVSLSVVAIFSGWAPNLVRDITEETSNSTLQTLNCDQASVDVRSAFYNSSSSELTVTVRNTDNTGLNDLIVAAFDSNDQVIEQKPGVNLSSGELDSTTLSGVSETPSYVQAFSKECGNVQDRLDDINQ